jgi:hypothetical protein
LAKTATLTSKRSTVKGADYAHQVTTPP